MQFSILAAFTLAAVAIASPTGLVARNVVSPRDTPAEAAAMTDAAGNVIPFNAQNVDVAPTKRGVYITKRF
ncbi:hypothetical protein GGI43DRAFT_76938 [Trichoderma evansii]